MFNVDVITPDGHKFKGECEYALVKNEFGEFAILKDHIPVVSVIDFGYIKLHNPDGSDQFVMVFGGLVEFSDNLLRVLTQEAEVGNSKEEALEYFKTKNAERREQNRGKSFDFAKMERDLKQNIKNIGAGKIST